MVKQTNWDDLKTTLALIQHGTLAGAAAELGVTYTTVARRIGRLEQALGEVLFERLADGYRPTEIAHLVAAQAQTMQGAEDALLRQIAGQDARLRGTLVITAPQLLITHFLGPVLQDFRTTYPDVDLNVRATNDVLDLNRREADVALRISRAPGDTLKGLRLSEQRSGWFAPKALAEALEQEPTTPLDVIAYKDYPSLPEGLLRAYPNARIQYVMDDMVAILGAAQNGLGAARMPLFIGAQSPALVRLPKLEPQPYIGVWLVAHPDIWASAKVAAFREIVVRYTRRSKALFIDGGV